MKKSNGSLGRKQSRRKRIYDFIEIRAEASNWGSEDETQKAAHQVYLYVALFIENEK